MSDVNNKLQFEYCILHGCGMAGHQQLCRESYALLQCSLADLARCVGNNFPHSTNTVAFAPLLSRIIAEPSAICAERFSFWASALRMLIVDMKSAISGAEHCWSNPVRTMRPGSAFFTHASSFFLARTLRLLNQCGHDYARYLFKDIRPKHTWLDCYNDGCFIYR